MDTTPSRAVALTAPAARRTAALVTALALVLAALVTGAVTARPAGATSAEDLFTAKINQVRAAQGVPRLTTRASLVSVARDWARTMARQSRLYHNPQLTSDVPNWRWVGENVGYGPDALTVHVAFMQSPAHRANIVDRDYTEVGVGAVVVGNRIWVAEVFRRPAREATRSFQAGFSSALRYGSTGSAVSRVQGRLGLRTTGYYGTYTKSAVTRFQHRQGWAGSGTVGPRTWSRLF